MNSTPVILFTYNRPYHTRATVESLRKNEGAQQTELVIYSDGAANDQAKQSVTEVRKYLATISGFRSVRVIERERNFGLGKNIISGVTEEIEKYGRVIVLEDDLLTSPYFLNYMNEALRVYEHHTEVISIHGYVYPVGAQLPETFFLKGADCLGWATWKRGWKYFDEDGSRLLKALKERKLEESFDFNKAYPYTRMLEEQVSGLNHSWAVRWYASAFLNNMYTLYPGRSLVFHNGGDGSGTNTGHDKMLNVTLSDIPVRVQMIPVSQNEKAFRAFSIFLKRLATPGLLYRLKRKWSMRTGK